MKRLFVVALVALLGLFTVTPPAQAIGVMASWWNIDEGNDDGFGFGLRSGGEWGIANASQSRPGFDCSGLAWWLVRRNAADWNVAPPRPYLGWTLPERTSAEMARLTTDRLPYEELRPGDLMFYDGDRNDVVDHVDVYIGNGYALDSSNTPGGVTVMWVGDGWYRDHFTYGRRVLPS